MRGRVEIERGDGKLEQRLRAYTSLLDSFIAGEMTAHDFASGYMAQFLKETEFYPETVYECLNDLFYIVEDFHPDPKLRDPGDPDEAALLSAARDLLKELNEIIGRISAVGEFVLADIGGIAASSNTAEEYSFQGSEEGLRAHIASITEAIRRSSRVCYVVGMGSAVHETYAKIEEIEGVTLLWSRSVLPRYARIFARLIASQSGLVRIDDAEKFPTVFSLLTEMAMAGVYIFSQEHEAAFVECVTKNRLPTDLSYGIKIDPGYFMYVVDGDNYGVKTGICEIVSYGHEADFVPSALRA